MVYCNIISLLELIVLTVILVVKNRSKTYTKQVCGEQAKIG